MSWMKELEEQVDQLTSYQQAHALLGNEPDIPMTYLLAMPSGWTGPPAYEAVVLDHIAKAWQRRNDQLPVFACDLGSG
jgi:hypothetical protein